MLHCLQKGKAVFQNCLKDTAVLPYERQTEIIPADHCPV